MIFYSKFLKGDSNRTTHRVTKLYN